MHIVHIEPFHFHIALINLIDTYVHTCLSERLIVFIRIHIGTNVTCVLGVNALQPIKSHIDALDLCGPIC